MLVILGWILTLGSLVGWIIILIDAFKNAVWKGILGFFCGLYLLYYAFAEFQHEKKGMIIAAWLIPLILGYALMFMGGAAAVAAAS